MRVQRTCEAVPTQYEITLDDGRFVYFRYRHGWWELDLADSRDAWFRDDTLSGLMQQYDNGSGGGYMSHSEVMGLLEIKLPALLAAPQA